MPKTAFVTGGTGFLGINLLHELCRQGWEITALHRPTSNLKYIQHLPIQLAEGSITDPVSLDKAIPEGTEVIFHLAGDTNQWSKRNEQQRAINVDGTRYMVEAAIKKKVPTFIHTSSIAAWGPVRGLTDENTPQNGATSWINYEKTKWEAEQEALKGIAQGLKVVVINPGSILGPYDTSSWASMFVVLKENQVPGVPPGTNTFVHVNDVVQAHILAVEKGQNGHNYLIAGENTSIQALAAEISRQLGRQKIPPKLPLSLMKLFAWFMGIGAFFSGKPPSVTPEIVSFMSRPEYAFSNAKALKELGYQMTPWQQGVKECYEWMTKGRIVVKRIIDPYYPYAGKDYLY